jgi:hypothetical protein
MFSKNTRFPAPGPTIQNQRLGKHIGCMPLAACFMHCTWPPLAALLEPYPQHQTSNNALQAVAWQGWECTAGCGVVGPE